MPADHNALVFNFHHLKYLSKGFIGRVGIVLNIVISLLLNEIVKTVLLIIVGFNMGGILSSYRAMKLLIAPSNYLSIYYSYYFVKSVYESRH